MKYAENILETIGNTPLVKLNKVLGEDFPALVLAKVETFNPGNSVKDRMALKMIEDAEKDGRLKPGGTIIEGTSGNTGMGLALAAIVKGYKCIFVTNSKQSKEKCDILRAVGAEVIVCPTDVKPTDPRSYYSVSKRLATETENGWYVNQYDNLSNREAHYESTAPEIWEQTDGKITHFLVGAGTGGTICGVGKFLKEKNENIKVIGVDTFGSILKEYHETGEIHYDHAYTYITEGIGEDMQAAIGKEMHHLEGGGAAVDDDGLAILAQLDRRLGDGALFGGVQTFLHRKGARVDADIAGRRDGLGPAAHPAQLFLDVQLRDVAPDRRLGGVGQLAQVGHRHDGPFLHGGQNDAMAFGFVHLVLPRRSDCGAIRSLSIMFNRRNRFCACTMIEIDRN